MRDYTISNDFGNELFQWWKELGPPTRWENVGNGDGQTKEPGRVRGWTGDWARLHRRGRNGPVLLILGLAWWGQAIYNAAAADGLGAGEAALEASAVWNLLVNDMQWVLACVLTQDRDAMEAWEKGREEEAREMAAESEKEAEEPAVEPKGKGKKAAAKKGSKAVPAKEKVASAKEKPAPAGGKRKRGDEKDLPPAKKVAEAKAVERPKPKPLTRGARTRASAEQEASNEEPSNRAEIQSLSNAGGGAGNPFPVVATAQTQTDAGNASTTVTATSSTMSIPPATTTSPCPEPVEGHLGESLPSTSGVLNTSRAGTTGKNTMDFDADTIDNIPSQIAAAGLDVDPFADNSGLTAEELAEISMDPDAEDDDEDAHF
ncbi:hypothetical protein B0H14DRAFT_3522254 [Mycena olivaceomarginata]|nr:hypothetical protein B0H14DRAFT_3522254 [Mycena olivaceomarginata]